MGIYEILYIILPPILSFLPFKKKNMDKSYRYMRISYLFIIIGSYYYITRLKNNLKKLEKLPFSKQRSELNDVDLRF